jgi:integrase/recombinase XerD
MAKKIVKRAIEHVSVEEAADDYLASIKRLKPATQQEYTYKLGLFVSWCEQHSIYLKDITARTIDNFLEHMKLTHRPRKADKEEISSRTLASEVRIIKIFLNWCLEDEQYSEYVKPIIIKRIKNVKITQDIIQTFTPEQIDALFKACDKEDSEHLQIRDRAILAVLLDTGIRATELCTLTLSNVILDAKESYVRVYGKGGKWGEVGLGDQSRKFLRKYIRLFRLPTIEHAKEDVNKALVFVNRSGDPLTANGLRQVIKRLGDWAKIEGMRCSPHDFRHTFAANFIRQGGDVYKLSKLLRHSSVGVTEDYLKSLNQSEARKGTKSVLDNLGNDG